MNINSIPINMEILCQDQHLKRKLQFPKQLIQINNQGQVDFKRTLQMNDPLRYTLLDCIVFLVDGESEIFHGVLNSAVLTSSSNSLTFPLTSSMRRQNIIELSFLRLPLKPQEQIITNLVKQQISQGISSASNSAGTIFSGSTQATPFAGSVQSRLKKRKSETLQTLTLVSSSSCPGVDRYNSSRKRQKLSLALDQDEEDEDSQEKQFKSHFSEVGNDNLNAKAENETPKSKKSQERTICEALQMVSLWRKKQDFYKNQSISKDFQQVAEEIGISKKTLDYYYLELRSAEYFHFDFDKNLQNKMGMLREFVSQAKKAYGKQYQSNKIPRQQQLKYQIPDEQIEMLNNQQRENKNISQFQQLHFELEQQERRILPGKQESQNHQNILNQHNLNYQNTQLQQKMISQNKVDKSQDQISSKKDISYVSQLQYPQHQTPIPPLTISQSIPEYSLEQQNHLINYHQQRNESLYHYPKQKIVHFNNQYSQRPFSNQDMNQRNISQNNSNYQQAQPLALNNQSKFQESTQNQNTNWYPIRHYQELQYDQNQSALNDINSCKTEFEQPQAPQLQSIFSMKNADSLISYV